MNPDKAFEIDNGIIIDGRAGIFAGAGVPTEPAPIGSLFLSNEGLFQYGGLGWVILPIVLRNVAGMLDFHVTTFSHWIPTL